MQVVDLTLPFADGRQGVAYQPELSLPQDGFNTTTLHIYSHALTHMDARKHFIEGGEGIEAISLERCMGPAHVIDLTHKHTNSLITVADFEAHADTVTSGVRLLLHTDWSTHADADDYRTQFPRISARLAAWFVERGVWLVGVETPSVASLAPENRAELTEVHQTLLGANVIIVEGLCNLNLLPPEVEFIALPLHLPGCDGSPVRAVARFTESEG
ncbi:MAG: cyclase family protein [Chloroflexota bacterium]